MKSVRVSGYSISIFAMAMLGGTMVAAEPAPPPLGRSSTSSEVASATTQPNSALGPVAASNAPLSASELLTLSTSTRQFRPHDAFDAAPALPLKGRRFRVELAVGTGGGSRSCDEAYWRYNTESGKLDLSLTGHLEMLDDFRHYDGTTFGLPAATFIDLIPTAVAIRCTEKSAGSYRASNAFDATTTVSRTNVVTLELIDARNLHPVLLESVGKPPAEAKQLVSFLRLIIEGQMEEWSPGQSLICGLKQTEPNMDSPYEVRTDFCAFKVTFQRASFVDSRSGQVLAIKQFPGA